MLPWPHPCPLRGPAWPTSGVVSRGPNCFDNWRLVALFLVAGRSALLLLARGDAALLGEARRAVGLILGDGHDRRGRIRIRPWGQGQRRPLQLAVRRLSPCRLATQGTQEPQGGT